MNRNKLSRKRPVPELDRSADDFKDDVSSKVSVEKSEVNATTDKESEVSQNATIETSAVLPVVADCPICGRAFRPGQSLQRWDRSYGLECRFVKPGCSSVSGRTTSRTAARAGACRRSSCSRSASWRRSRRRSASLSGCPLCRRREKKQTEAPPSESSRQSPS